jgi:hypothetical protein
MSDESNDYSNGVNSDGAMIRMRSKEAMRFYDKRMYNEFLNPNLRRQKTLLLTYD